jgi:hypothetical protein
LPRKGTASAPPENSASARSNSVLCDQRAQRATKDRRATHKQRVIAALERPGTFVEQALVNPKEDIFLEPDPIQGELQPYTRVIDLSDDLKLIPLEEIQNIDLIIHRYDKYHSAENDADFLTLEVSLLQNPEQRFLTNCGGQSARAKIEAAFQAVAGGKASGPLVAQFAKTVTTSGRTFWVLR